MRGPLCAVQAGCCAALASVSAKIATSYDAAKIVTIVVVTILNMAPHNIDLLSYVEEVRHFY